MKRAELKRKTRLARKPAANGTGLARKPARKKTSRRTGFSAAVKRAVRVRAGNGDPGAACCEACAVHLGEHGGEVQHRVARGMGGSSRPVINSVVNAALLCGAAALRTGCHGLAESRDAGMHERGFWLRQDEDPAQVPVILAGPHGLGAMRWLAADGTYSTMAPKAVAA